MQRAFLLVALAILVTGVPAFADAGPVNARDYLGGGYALNGTSRQCTPSLPFDIGAACAIPCPEGTCSISVIDVINGNDVSFKVCVPNSTTCYLGVYHGTAYIVAPVVDVVPHVQNASSGTVYVA